MNPRLLSFPVALAVVAAGLLGCGNRNATPAQTEAATAALQPPPPPPPTIAAQHELALTGGGARMTDDGLYVTVPGSDFGGKKQDEFMPSNAEALNHVAGLLKERVELHLQITGYGDDHGAKGAKQKLPQQHAEAVRDYLVMQKHVDADRIELKTASDAGPAAASGAAAGNGGVELRIMTADGKYVSRAALGVQPAGSPSPAPGGSAP